MMILLLHVRVREEQHQQVMRRRQEMEREAAVTLMSKKAGDSVSAVSSAALTQKLDEPTAAGRNTTRQNAPEDRSCNKTELTEKQKLRSVQLYHLYQL